VLDGGRRAVAPAATALLYQLEALEPHEAQALAGFASPPLRNVAGRAVGRIEVQAADTISALPAS
jgi:L-asparaginase II